MVSSTPQGDQKRLSQCSHHLVKSSGCWECVTLGGYWKTQGADSPYIDIARLKWEGHMVMRPTLTISRLVDNSSLIGEKKENSGFYHRVFICGQPVNSHTVWKHTAYLPPVWHETKPLTRKLKLYSQPGESPISDVPIWKSLSLHQIHGWLISVFAEPFIHEAHLSTDKMPP